MISPLLLRLSVCFHLSVYVCIFQWSAFGFHTTSISICCFSASNVHQLSLGRWEFKWKICILAWLLETFTSVKACIEWYTVKLKGKKNAKWDRRVRKRRKSSTVFHPNIIHFSCKICYSACTCTHHILKDFMVFAFKHILSSLVLPSSRLECAHIFSRSFACNLYYFHQAIFLSMNFYGEFHSNSNVSRLLQFHFNVCVYFGVYLLFYFIFCWNWVRRMHRYAQISDRNVPNTKPINKLIVHSFALRDKSNDFLIFRFRRIIWLVEYHFKWLLTFPKSLTPQSVSINSLISIRFLFIPLTFVMNVTKLKQIFFGREGVQIEPTRFRPVSSRKIKSKNPTN